jgi:hypothetical protein
MLRTSFHEYMYATHHILLIHAAHHILMIRACYFADNAASAGSEYMARTTFYCLAPTLLLIRACYFADNAASSAKASTPCPTETKNTCWAPHLWLNMLHTTFYLYMLRTTFWQRPQRARLAQRQDFRRLQARVSRHVTFKFSCFCCSLLWLN